jgi:hypothetical protein
MQQRMLWQRQGTNVVDHHASETAVEGVVLQKPPGEYLGITLTILI